MHASYMMAHKECSALCTPAVSHDGALKAAACVVLCELGGMPACEGCMFKHAHHCGGVVWCTFRAVCYAVRGYSLLVVASRLEAVSIRFESAFHYGVLLTQKFLSLNWE